MKIVKKFQDGGAVAPVDGGAPADVAPVNNGMTPEGGQDPMQMIVEAFVAGLQNQDCEALAQGAQMFLELVQQAQGGAEAAPAGQPVFGKGGKIVSRKQTSLQLVRK